MLPLLLLALVLTVACASLDKREVEGVLAGLPKNRPLAELGIQRRPIAVDLDGERRDAELAWVHVPKRPRPGDEPLDAGPLVLVHDTPSSLFTWADLVLGGEDRDGLRRWFDVYLVEVIGHGIAPSELPPYSFQRCADWVAGAVEALGLERVVLVGSSYGGEFAWRAALDVPERIERLVLIDASGYRREDDEFLSEERAMRRLPLARYGYALNSRDRIRAALEPHFRAAVDPQRVEEVFTVCENADNWRAMVDLVRDEDGGRAAEIADLAQPTLLVWGADDLAYPPERFAARFAGDIASARLVVVPGTGHYPHVEEPARVVAEIVRFVQEPPE